MQSKILIVGMGGLGSPCAIYLAAAGVGTLGLLDADTVEISNLHRQVVHSERTVGQSKVESAADFIKSLNSHCSVTTHNEHLTRDNAAKICSQYDIVVDCSDNAPTRYLVNDVCILLGIPLVSASALRSDGQLTVFGRDTSAACYRCLHPQAPQRVTNCSEGGVIGCLVGTLGTMQAAECIKIVLHKVQLENENVRVLSGRMLVYNALSTEIRMLKMRGRRSDCAVCGDIPTIALGSLPDYEEWC